GAREAGLLGRGADRDGPAVAGQPCPVRPRLRPPAGHDTHRGGPPTRVGLGRRRHRRADRTDPRHRRDRQLLPVRRTGRTGRRRGVPAERGLGCRHGDHPGGLHPVAHHDRRVHGAAADGGAMTIRAVWTDFGGVLTPPVSQTLMAFCAKTGLEPGPLMQATMKVTERYGTDDIMLPLDTPLVTEQEWLRQVGDILEAEHGITTRVTSLADAWFGDRETNQAWLDRLRAVRDAGLFVGMLSNMPPAWDEHWRRMVDPSGLFDEVVLSFQVGHRKPAREIFDIAGARSGFAPA